MKIETGRPPNFDAIAARFPHAAGNGVIFAYGDTIYSPGGKDIPFPLLAHEEAHGIRQRLLGVEAWWEKYLADDVFRYAEELIGHHAELLAQVGKLTDRNAREKLLWRTAERVRAPLYDYNPRPVLSTVMSTLRRIADTAVDQ